MVTVVLRQPGLSNANYVRLGIFSIAASVSARRFLFVSERALKAKIRGCVLFLCLEGAAGVGGGGAGSG
jgi:hypothetical protein